MTQAGRELQSSVRVVCVKLQSNPDLQPSSQFLPFKNTSYHIICSTHGFTLQVNWNLVCQSLMPKDIPSVPECAAQAVTKL